MTEPNNNDRRTLAEWLRDVTRANPDLLDRYLDPITSRNEGIHSNNRHQSPRPPLTPQDLQKMGRSDEQAEHFHRMLQANSEKSDVGYEDLLGLSESVGWLHTTKCLSALRAVLGTVEKRGIQERPVLLKILINQLATFPPQDEDYEEPTFDQASALDELLRTISDHLTPEQWPEVLPCLREALGAACGGMEYHMGDLTLEDAIAKAQPTRDMSSFLDKLAALEAA